MKEFINVHAVNKSKLIIGGDFNSVLTTGDRCSGVIGKSTRVLTDFIKNLSLIDIWKSLTLSLTGRLYIC